jgi:hypothetical protein
VCALVLPFAGVSGQQGRNGRCGQARRGAAQQLRAQPCDAGQAVALLSSAGR